MATFRLSRAGGSHASGGGQSSALNLDVCITQNAGELPKCERMIVYLNAQTWTSGAASARLAEDVAKAISLQVPLLLCHEMRGLGQEGRHGCEFDQFFAHPKGATPQSLLRANIYATIATTPPSP